MNLHFSLINIKYISELTDNYKYFFVCKKITALKAVIKNTSYISSKSSFDNSKISTIPIIETTGAIFATHE